VKLQSMTGTTPNGATVDLFAQHLQLEAGGTISVDERRMGGGADSDWRLSLFHAETADDVHSDHWEMHPLADEAVCCLNGAIRLCLRATQPDTADDLILILPGRAVIVPRGRWHRLELEEPTDLLATTVRRGTELQEVNPRIETPGPGRQHRGADSRLRRA
jgi:mannose-6-phosphate isomerase-like protein (cupin superfamily)